MELKKHNQTKEKHKTPPSSVLFAGLILGVVLVVSFSYAISNHVIDTATAQNMAPKNALIATISHGILGKTGYLIGLWLPEMTHPFSALQNAVF